MNAVRTLIIVLLAAVVLAGCGRRGGLEDPAELETSLAPSTAETDVAPGSMPADDDASPGAQVQQRSAPDVIADDGAEPQRRFFLDFLL